MAAFHRPGIKVADHSFLTPSARPFAEAGHSGDKLTHVFPAPGPNRLRQRRASPRRLAAYETDQRPLYGPPGLVGPWEKPGHLLLHALPETGDKNGVRAESRDKPRDKRDM